MDNPDILETKAGVTLTHDLVVIESQINRLLFRVYKQHGIHALNALLCAEITAFTDYHACQKDHEQ